MSIADAVRRKRGSLAVWGALGVVVVLIVVFAANPRPPEQLEAEEEKAVPVRTMETGLRSVEDVLRLPGRIEPLQAAALGAERAGRVVEVLAEKGQEVEEGQVLLQIDRRLWEAARRRAEIEARDAARDLARWKELEKTGAVSASDFESVERRQAQADIVLEETQVMLSQCEVRAPFAGVIVDRFVDLGDYANEGQAVIQLIRLDRVKVAFDVPEQDIGPLQAGQRKTFTLSAVPGREFEGEVTFLSSQAARDSNSFAAELEAENPGGALKAGMIAEVNLVREMKADAILVPLAAIVPRKGEHTVFVVRDGRAVRKRVLLGALIGHEGLLEGGLEAGEQLVVEGHRGLQDGMKVAMADALPEE